MNKISKVAMMLLLGASTIVAEKSLSEDELNQVANMKTSFLQGAYTPAAGAAGSKCNAEGDVNGKNDGCNKGLTCSKCLPGYCPMGKSCKIDDSEACIFNPTADGETNCSRCANPPTVDATKKAANDQSTTCKGTIAK